MQRDAVHPGGEVHRRVQLIAELEIDIAVIHRGVQADRAVAGGRAVAVPLYDFQPRSEHCIV